MPRCATLRRFAALTFLALLFVAAPAWAGPTYDDFEIGRDDTASDAALKVRGDPDLLDWTLSIELTPAGGPFGMGGMWDGYLVAGSPVFRSLSADEPGNSFYRLPTLHEVTLQRSFAPAYFSMFTSDTSTQIMQADDDIYTFAIDGLGDFTDDFYFAVAPGTPNGTIFQAEFLVYDELQGEGGMIPSEAFSIQFIVLPEPATLLLAAAALVMRRKR